MLARRVDARVPGLVDWPLMPPETATCEPLLSRLQKSIASVVARPLFWMAAIAFLLSWPMVGALRRHLPPPLPVTGTLADFTLRDENGRDFGSADLRGKVWVSNFIFTRCPTVCPRLTTKMGQVQHRARNLGTAIRLVSFTVDPENDTPEVLAAYAKKHRASPRMWSFLTGDRAAIEKVVILGLKIGMGKDGGDAPANLFHDNHFALIDQKMQIRGYYAVEEEGEIDRLMRDIGLLIARGG